jgi:hypothetical protein
MMICAGCELITIGSKRPQPIIIDQSSPVGAIYLFKTELDSNNIPAATQILANPNGRVLLAFEKYELYDEVARIGRMIASKPITQVKSDSLSPQSYRISMEFSYLKQIAFTTTRINDYWYIVHYQE